LLRDPGDYTRKNYLSNESIVIYSPGMDLYSIYLHIPFCRHRCGYCDFNTYAGLESLISNYVDALCLEVDYLSQEVGSRIPVHTIFFGGGTPSLLPSPEIEKIFQRLQTAFIFQDDLEVTLEANPGTLSQAYLNDLRSLGVTRLSLGAQSSHPEELRLLERQHDYLDVIRAVTWARRAGFDNLNLDLIFGLPGQQLQAWQSTLNLSLDLFPEHISLYALTVEHGTPLSHWVSHGQVSAPDPDVQADMYEWSSDRMSQAGYTQYEISNWGIQNDQGEIQACRHNLQYWRNLPYLGFGAGAHGFAGGVRTANVLAPGAYIQRMNQTSAGPVKPEMSFPRTPATQVDQPIDQQTEIGETMMMGLRLTQEGVSASVFNKRFGLDMEEYFRKEISELIGFGLLEWAGEGNDTLRLTPEGRLLGNQVFMQFI
jgi:oxygen-independent coproporphyrinogen-3 oxidase